MWPFGKITCLVCGEHFSKHELKFSPGDGKVAVCRYCFEGWWMRGRKCGRCGEQVAGAQAIAVFAEQRSIGHFDCGGVPLRQEAKTHLVDAASGPGKRYDDGR